MKTSLQVPVPNDGSDCLPEVFLKELTPTFLALSDPKLFERCARDATQNPNECLNYIVWARCPKHKHRGIKVVRCAVASAVCHFHSGAASRESVMRRLSTPAGHHTIKASHVQDRKRLRNESLSATQPRRKNVAKDKHSCGHAEKLFVRQGLTCETGGF